MIVILGCIVVIACVLGGFTIAGGHIHALIHPSELLTIGGATLGAMIVMSPKKVLIDLVHGVIGAVKGSPFTKDLYREMFKLMYSLLKMARRDGLLAIEPHIYKPEESALFQKHPKLLKDHHVLHFICEGLSPIVDNVATPEQVKELLDLELHVIEDEHHKPVDVLAKAADALPGFGIVAAVLGIVITMGAINGPVEEIGHKVGAALVGTFLGILLSYGFFGPLASRMELQGHEQMSFYRTIAGIILAFGDDTAPKMAIEKARRGIGTELRPNREELESLFKEADAA